jgi:hypothetical protein
VCRRDLDLCHVVQILFPLARVGGSRMNASIDQVSFENDAFWVGCLGSVLLTS